MRGATLSVAESCTGGLLAERITRISGSSRYFMGGALVYSDALKRDFCGVPPLLLASDGAVSRPVAAALAEGIRQRCKTTLGIGITGVAGPERRHAKKSPSAWFISRSPTASTPKLWNADSPATATAFAGLPPNWRSICCAANSDNLMRLFVALDIDEAIQQRLDDYVRTLQPRLPGVRFVRSNTYHVTLKFLGEVPTRTPVRERLRGVRAASIRDSQFAASAFFPTRAPHESSGPESRPRRCPTLARAASISRSRRWLSRRSATFIPISPWRATDRAGRVRCARERAPEAFAQLACNCGVESGARVRYNDGARILLIRKQVVAQRAELLQARSLRLAD